MKMFFYMEFCSLQLTPYDKIEKYSNQWENETWFFPRRSIVLIAGVPLEIMKRFLLSGCRDTEWKVYREMDILPGKESCKYLFQNGQFPWGQRD